MVTLRMLEEKLEEAGDGDRGRRFRRAVKLPLQTRLPPAGCIRNRDCRRTFFQKWLDADMTEPLPLLIESSIEIAWDYLARTGELGDAMVAGHFLSDTIELMVRRGERRRLMLANKAIAAYQQFRRQQSVPQALASA
jgi:hypothetical protein